MKYLVMECHEGYAVLMDEESRFVNAANLHYEVGQTVTEPILLETENKQKTGGRRIIMHAVKMAAAAACLTVVTVAGFSFFGKEKPAPRSVVFVSAAAEIEMELDDKGSVVRLKSDSEQGNEIIEKYIEAHGKTNDRMDTANDILAIQVEDGYISGGDTVDVYVPDDNKGFEEYKTELEDRVSELDINVNIKKLETPPPNHEKPTPPAATGKNGPAHEEATRPSAPTAPHEAPKPDGKHTTPAVVPPTVPEEPVPPVAPDEKATAPEPPSHEHPEHPEPPHGNEGRAGHGPAALPAPPEAPEPPAAPEAAEGPAAEEPINDELPQEANEKDMIDSQ
ncbi:MAG: hypothetical protein J6U16_08125 [Ruminococcus sp.]|nr:hypothetical protein [Ruminococcus sp.]